MPPLYIGPSGVDVRGGCRGGRPFGFLLGKVRYGRKDRPYERLPAIQMLDPRVRVYLSGACAGNGTIGLCDVKEYSEYTIIHAAIGEDGSETRTCTPGWENS